MNTEQLTSESWQEANNENIRGIKTKPRSIEIHVITQVDAKDNGRKNTEQVIPTTSYLLHTNTAGINIRKREQYSKHNRTKIPATH